MVDEETEPFVSLWYKHDRRDLFCYCKLGSASLFHLYSITLVELSLFMGLLDTELSESAVQPEDSKQICVSLP